MKPAAVIQALAALAHASRLEVFRLLVRRGPEGYPAGDIGQGLRIPGPTLSFHLEGAIAGGPGRVTTDGRFVFYSASIERMNALMFFLTDNCCSLGSSGSTSCPPVVTARSRKSA
ncbi:MAG: helix-turn-helix transcriptional regulator [Proteobacteria bacterium]|nr:helix-turn-helix transcriptional regulator [Pseudomonadota bacterium]